MVASHLKESFSEQLVICTDASLEQNRNSGTAAAVIPALDYEFAGRLSCKIALTTAELGAVQLAL